MSAIREGRTDRQPPTREQRMALAAIADKPGYEVLLDLMENACIKQETILLNVEAEKDAEVLAQHKISKAMWLFFVRLQKEVQQELAALTAEAPPQPPSEQEEQDAMLDPIREAEIAQRRAPQEEES